MAWTVNDIRLSIQRYLAMTLPPEWEIRAERRYVGDDQRPVAVIETGSLSTQSARTSPIQGEVTELIPITITAFPKLADIAEDTPPEEVDVDVYRMGRSEADQLVTHLARWVGMGVTIKDDDGRRWSGPERMPLWDYYGVPVGASDADLPEWPHDVLWVEEGSAETRPIQDESDPLRWSVICEFQVSMESPGRGPADDEVMEIASISGSFAGPPSQN